MQFHAPSSSQVRLAKRHLQQLVFSFWRVSVHEALTCPAHFEAFVASCLRCKVSQIDSQSSDNLPLAVLEKPVEARNVHKPGSYRARVFLLPPPPPPPPAGAMCMRMHLKEGCNLSAGIWHGHLWSKRLAACIDGSSHWVDGAWAGCHKPPSFLL